MYVMERRRTLFVSRRVRLRSRSSKQCFFGPGWRRPPRVVSCSAPVPFLIEKTLGFLLSGKITLEDLKKGG
jgi:hypothetical protein